MQVNTPANSGEGLEKERQSTRPSEPQVGDEWEFKLPGKPRRVKVVGSVDERHGKRVDGTTGPYPYVSWERLPKGRYTGLSVWLLMQYGRRISTKVERDTHLESLIARAKARREAERVTKQQATNDI